MQVQGTQESIPSLAGRYDNPYMSYRPAKLHRLAESIPRNPNLGSLTVYKFWLWIKWYLDFFLEGVDSLITVEPATSNLLNSNTNKK
jgi:hypothetical protein